MAQNHERLGRAGCEDFPARNPNQTICLLLRKMKPPALMADMLRLIQFDTALEKIALIFIERLTEEARACEKYDKGSSSSERSTDSAHGNGNDRKHSGGYKKRLGPKRDSGRGEAFQKQLPVCLWTPHAKHGIRHLFRDCKESETDQKKPISTSTAENVPMHTKKA